MIPIRFVPVVLYISTVVSQSPSLMAATENRPDLSMFRQLLINNPGPARTLLSNTPVAPGEGKTLLLPNNDAFANFEQENGTPVEGASENFMSALLNYHTLNGDYTNEQLNQPGGMTAPSALLDDTYNHRVPVTEVAQPKDGQVVLITQVAGLGQFQTRAENPLYAQSGLGKQIGVNQTSTDWVGGKFHVVNGFLTLPRTCSKTMEATKLNRLLRSLNRTNLTQILDNSTNVTCLAPHDVAFSAGNPDQTLPVKNLSDALLFHTLPLPTYITDLKDGQVFKSLQGGSVRVTKKENGDIYFNDAKVIAQNVITNNGVVHVLDKIMSAMNTTAPLASSNETPGVVPTFSGSSSTTAFHGMYITVCLLLIVWAPWH